MCMGLVFCPGRLFCLAGTRVSKRSDHIAMLFLSQHELNDIKVAKLCGRLIVAHQVKF